MICLDQVRIRDIRMLVCRGNDAEIRGEYLPPRFDLLYHNHTFYYPNLLLYKVRLSIQIISLILNQTGLFSLNLRI